MAAAGFCFACSDPLTDGIAISLSRQTDLELRKETKIAIYVLLLFAMLLFRVVWEVG
jgi:hypothetical protein